MNNLIPDDAFEKLMIFDHLHVFETNSLKRISLTKLLDEIYRMLVIYYIIVDFIAQYFVKYFFIYLPWKHLLTRTQLIDDTSKCPEVRVESTLVLLQHFRSNIKRSSAESTVSFSSGWLNFRYRTEFTINTHAWTLSYS